LKKRDLYLLAFFEGAFVVSVELCGGKLLSPVFGSSLYIWTSVIGITLLSLTLGYFLGGLLSRKNNSLKILFRLFAIASISALLMPFITKIFLVHFLGMSLFKGCIIMSLALLLCPLLCLGATSPILIQLYLSDLKSAGKIAGRFYAMSSLGGILNTFLLGFLIIPQFGIRLPLFVSCMLMLLATFFIPGKKLKTAVLFFSAFALIAFQLFGGLFKKSENDVFKDIYESEGIMGQLKVVDFINNNGTLSRALLNNNSAQSIITKTNVTAISQYNYVHFISAVSSLKPEGSNVLLLGMAGGSLVYELQNQKLNVDVVDIDERMFYIAEHYFYFQKNTTNLFVDDARHFIKSTKKKYDIVIIDISSSEVQPSYLYTIECFKEVKKALAFDGLFFINFQGVMEGKSNLALATWSVYNTIKAAGFKPYFYSFSNNQTDDIQFVSSQKEINISKLDSSEINLCCLQNLHVLNLLKNDSLKSSIAHCQVEPLTLIDDKPQLEKLKFETVVNSRNDIRKEMKKREALAK
jgi:predicted membrane-bound spermidine synthase